MNCKNTAFRNTNKWKGVNLWTFVDIDSFTKLWNFIPIMYFVRTRQPFAQNHLEITSKFCQQLLAIVIFHNYCLWLRPEGGSKVAAREFINVLRLSDKVCHLSIMVRISLLSLRCNCHNQLTKSPARAAAVLPFTSLVVRCSYCLNSEKKPQTGSETW